jgi:hypothetical protein
MYGEDPMTAATPAGPARLRAARKRAQYRRMVADTAAVREARREQRVALEVWRPAAEGGVGMFEVDYGCAELVRREKGEAE